MHFLYVIMYVLGAYALPSFFNVTAYVTVLLGITEEHVGYEDKVG